jgi:hypothetical protein
MNRRKILQVLAASPLAFLFPKAWSPDCTLESPCSSCADMRRRTGKVPEAFFKETSHDITEGPEGVFGKWGVERTLHVGKLVNGTAPGDWYFEIADKTGRVILGGGAETYSEAFDLGWAAIHGA